MFKKKVNPRGPLNPGCCMIDRWQSTSDTLDGKFRGRESGHCPVGLCKHKKSSAELCTMLALLRQASWPSQNPGRQTGTEPQDLLALTTSRCLLQASRTTSVARRARATGLFLLTFKRGKLQRQCKQVRGPPHTHSRVFALILVNLCDSKKCLARTIQELKNT